MAWKNQQVLQIYLGQFFQTTQSFQLCQIFRRKMNQYSTKLIFVNVCTITKCPTVERSKSSMIRWKLPIIGVLNHQDQIVMLKVLLFHVWIMFTKIKIISLSRWINVVNSGVTRLTGLPYEEEVLITIVNSTVIYSSLCSAFGQSEIW